MLLKENIKGLDYFKLALLAFMVLGLDVVLARIEPFFYGQPVKFDNWTIISHWSLICILWYIATFLMIKYAIKRYGFKLKENKANLKVWQWAVVVGLILLSCFISYMNWNGFKILIEFNNLGMFKFSMQYLYYFFKTVLFTLIIVFGQKAFEKWFRNEKIPYGGIICALTWGLAHMFTKSSFEAGVLSAFAGFGFGAVYLY